MDIKSVLTKLLKKGEPYLWTEIHQKVFSELKNILQTTLILIYLDAKKPYIILFDASKYCWGATLHQHTLESDNLDGLRLIIFISVKSSRTQCNNAVVDREVFAVYMSVKRISFFLIRHRCTILCGHKPLEKF